MYASKEFWELWEFWGILESVGSFGSFGKFREFSEFWCVMGRFVSFKSFREFYCFLGVFFKTYQSFFSDLPLDLSHLHTLIWHDGWPTFRRILTQNSIQVQMIIIPYHRVESWMSPVLYWNTFLYIVYHLLLNEHIGEIPYLCVSMFGVVCRHIRYIFETCIEHHLEQPTEV